MKYFGTDGIRGIPNRALSADLALMVGKSLALLNKKRVIIGTDTRHSRDLIASAAIAGALSAGLEVTYIKIASTPAVIYLANKYDSLGVIITASHNPYNYNGIKIVKNGRKLSNVEETLIEDFLDNPNRSYLAVGKLAYNKQLIKEYHSFLLKGLVNTSLSISIDCANGAVYKTAPAIFNLVSTRLAVMGDKPNGVNINADVGSTNISSLGRFVLENKSDIGFSFDGDGDRVICVDELGNEVSGDILIYILAIYYKQKGLLKNNCVVLSKMSNIGIIKALNKESIEVVLADIGDKNILAKIDEYGLALGGENSGHIITHRLFTGDGILVALELLRVLEETNTLLTDWKKRISLYDESLENIVVKNKKSVMCDILQQRIAIIERELGSDGKIIVRPSGTEECIRVLIMAKTKEKILRYQAEIIDLIRLLDA